MITAREDHMVTRLFIYTAGNIDDAFKLAAKASLSDAGWNVIAEYDGPVQAMVCSGAERSTCNASTDGNWAAIAQR